MVSIRNMKVNHLVTLTIRHATHPVSGIIMNQYVFDNSEKFGDSYLRHCQDI